MIAPTQGLFVLLLALIVLGFGGFFWRASLLYRLLRLGRNEDRNDRPLRRLRDEIVIYLGQRKLLKRPYYVRGIGHALIFWGFLVITYGSADLLIAGLFGRHLPFTDTGLYAWTLDIFAVAVLVSVIVAVVRRAFLKPPRMHIAPEGYVILGLISFLMLSLLVFESAGIAAGQSPALEDGWTTRGWIRCFPIGSAARAGAAGGGVYPPARCRLGSVQGSAFPMPTLRLSWMRAGGRSLAVTNVHIQAPVEGRAARWRSDLAALGGLAARPATCCCWAISMRPSTMPSSASCWPAAREGAGPARTASWTRGPWPWLASLRPGPRRPAAARRGDRPHRDQPAPAQQRLFRASRGRDGPRGRAGHAVRPGQGS